MMVMADCSKAFDAVRFKSVLTKMHVMGFSKSFLRLMLNYSVNEDNLSRLMQKGLTWKSLISAYPKVPH